LLWEVLVTILRFSQCAVVYKASEEVCHKGIAPFREPFPRLIWLLRYGGQVLLNTDFFQGTSSSFSYIRISQVSGLGLPELWSSVDTGERETRGLSSSSYCPSMGICSSLGWEPHSVPVSSKQDCGEDGQLAICTCLLNGSTYTPAWKRVCLNSSPKVTNCE
jgi:hypothetical protein